MRERRWWIRETLRLRTLLRRGRMERDLDEEMQFHIDHLIEREIAKGLSPVDARNAALRAMEGLEQKKEECRDMRRTQWIDQFLQDLKYASRSLLKNPTVSLVAFASLALGIGANTAIFSLINTVLMRPLPGVASPEGLVRLTSGSFSFPQFESLHAQQLFAHTVAVTDDQFQVEIAGTPRISNAALVSGEYFSALGVNVAHGRPLNAEDERTQSLVAVLDYGFWERAFSANPQVIGQSMRVNRMAVTIIGVAPPEFHGVVVGRPADFTIAITVYPLLRPERSEILTRRSAHWLTIMGRLLPDSPLEQSNARLQVIWPQVLAATAPADTRANDEFFERKTALEAAGNGFSPLRRAYTSPLYILMGLVGLVLLVACVNIANLLIARGAARHREFAIRQSIGAGRSRLIRQLLTESLLLSALAGTAGLLLAIGTARYLVTFISSSSNPISLDLSLDARVLAFSAAATILSAILCGLAPAIRGSRVDLSSGLKESARNLRGGAGLRRILVVAQIALSMILAVGSGLFLNSFRQLRAIDVGFSPTGVLLARADAVTAGYREERAMQFFKSLEERVSVIPGVESAGLAWAPPVSRGFGNNGRVSAEGRPPLSGQDRVAWSNFISPGYIGAIGQRLVAGRDFTDQDRANSPLVAIVNQTMARHYFGNENPIGKRIDTRGGTKFDCEIVGVVRDAIHFDPKEKQQRVFYEPYAQGPDFLGGENMILAVRTGDSAGAANRIRAAVSNLDRSVATEIETLQTHVDGSLARETGCWPRCPATSVDSPSCLWQSDSMA